MQLIKSIIFTLLSVLAVAQSNAATYYVRTDGGTISQCTGLSNAAYPGSGTGQACAVNHPYWLATLDGNGGGSTIFSGGDTVVIGAGSYPIGYGAPNTSACNINWSYGCTMPAIPSGTSGNPTKIIGCSTSGCGGSTKPELHAVYGAYYILSAVSKSYITLQDLELTQHDVCESGGSNPPTSCSGKSSYGNFGFFGEYAQNITLEGLYIHRMSKYGIQAGGVRDWTVSNTTIRANGLSGWNGDTTTQTTATFYGNFVLSNSTVEYNGCSETYPGGVVVDCWGQGGIDPHDSTVRGGNGDGIAFGNGNIGNWIITNSSISYNTQDGFDGLHGDGVGDSVHVNRSRFEGNAGQQIKIQATFDIENSIIIGDCNYFHGKSFDYGVAHCRALGDTIHVGLVSDQVGKIYNSTIVAGGNVLLLTEGAQCNASTKLLLNNNIWVGGYDWQQDPVANPSGGGDGRKTSFFWAGGSDGNGTGTCGAVTPTQDYDIVYGTKNNAEGCSGANSKCNVNPGFANTILLGPASTGYTTTANLYQQVTLGSGSVGIGAARSTVNLLFPATDYTGLARGSAWDIGAYNYGSESYSCSDGIQNGDETGIDCGGSCPNACSTPGIGVRPWAISGRAIAPSGRPIAQ